MIDVALSLAGKSKPMVFDCTSSITNIAEKVEVISDVINYARLGLPAQLMIESGDPHESRPKEYVVAYQKSLQTIADALSMSGERFAVEVKHMLRGVYKATITYTST
ncbi:MAG: hypothetical protein EXS55_01575 [Candidatus Magasanikbacteria bacterium]|nr:hypothetical protein [Candidatus Magasanikbacteria bacterium]